MTRCAVTTGFFTLAHCGRPSAAMCGGCGRAACADHLVPAGLCAECAAAQGHGAQHVYEPNWTRGYRRSYYQRSSQAYMDTSWYTGFDEFDREAFEPGRGHDLDYEHFDGNDYVDS